MKPNAREIAERIQKAAENYRLVAVQLRAGRRLPMDMILATIQAAAKSSTDLLLDVCSTERAGISPGQPCAICGRPLVVYTSRRSDKKQIQYVHCGGCGAKPRNNKITVPAELIRRRRRRKPRCRDPPGGRR